MHALTRTRDLLCRSQAFYHHVTPLIDSLWLLLKLKWQKIIEASNHSNYDSKDFDIFQNDIKILILAIIKDII
jgi:hypothetical protein